MHAAGSESQPTLRAGNRVRYTAEGLQTLPALPVERLAAWRKGELLFEAKPVEAAIAEIARYRRILKRR